MTNEHFKGYTPAEVTPETGAKNAGLYLEKIKDFDNAMANLLREFTPEEQVGIDRYVFNGDVGPGAVKFVSDEAAPGIAAAIRAMLAAPIGERPKLGETIAETIDRTE